MITNFACKFLAKSLFLRKIMNQKRTAFFISDSTGITAKKLGQSLLAQFDNIEFDKVMLPYIDTEAKAQAVVEQVNLAFARDDQQPIIFDTIIQKDIRKIVATCNGFMVEDRKSVV